MKTAVSTFDSGLDIQPADMVTGFTYGDGHFGPTVEHRKLDAIRPSLRKPDCEGPEIVYSIAMDVGKNHHLPLLKEMHLLYGAVTYAAGQLGEEPIRSQGHIHKKSAYANGWSTPEVYEIWQGEAVIYMQETAKDQPGRCFAVHAKAGEVVIVPPSWAHATISADPSTPLTFGAWCDRDYGFDYEDVRAHHGLSYFPLVDAENKGLKWVANPHYEPSNLIIKKSPRNYTEFGIDPSKSIYQQFEEQPDRFEFVPRPDLYAEKWVNFEP